MPFELNCFTCDIYASKNFGFRYHINTQYAYFFISNSSSELVLEYPRLIFDILNVIYACGFKKNAKSTALVSLLDRYPDRSSRRIELVHKNEKEI